MIDKADLWLLRHAEAIDPEARYSDAGDYARPLTKTGVRQALNAGNALRRLADVDRVVSSPRVRCLQTAALAYGTPVKTHKDLDHGKPGAPMDHAKDGKTTLVVGHHVLEDGVKKVTGKAVTLPIGGLALIEIRDGQCKLAKLLTPEDIAKLA